MKPWLNRLARCLQIVLFIVAGVIATCVAMIWFERNKINPGFAVLASWPMLLLAVVFHELGHFVGAKLVGMTVLSVNIAGIEIRPLQRGLKVRRSSLKRLGVGGFVYAIPQFERPMRKQMLCLLGGGVASNFAVALVSVVLGMLLSLDISYMALAFGALNAGLALGNLVPYQGVMATDGLQLLRWLKGIDEADPRLAGMRLSSRSLSGQTADQLPDADLSLLEEQSVIGKVTALWYRLKADQFQGAWEQTPSRIQRLNELLDQSDQKIRTFLKDQVEIMWTELAFSESMRTTDASALDKNLTSKSMAWFSPWLIPRCKALEASLAGDRERCDAFLTLSEQESTKSLDLALHRSEAVLRQYIRDISTQSHRALAV